MRTHAATLLAANQPVSKDTPHAELRRSSIRSRPFARDFDALIVAAVPALAQQPVPSASMAPVIYPAKGQTAKEQDQDRYECYSWSKGQSGFDPAQPVQLVTAASQPGRAGGTAGAMMIGAGSGAAVAGLTNHDAGRGAAAGALGGGLLARAKERQAMQAAQQQASQQQMARNQQKSHYDRAFGACMEARGYVIK
jgi:hypothetical protein